MRVSQRDDVGSWGGKIIYFVSVPKETPFPQIPAITQKPAFLGNL